MKIIRGILIVLLFYAAALLILPVNADYLDNSPLPLAEYHFDEAAGTVAYDTSGNGYHGTITGASHSPGLSGNGILFNGISDYIEVPTPYSPENAFTIEAWIKTSSPNVQAIFGGSSTGIDKYHPNLGVGYGISQRAAGCVNYYGAYLSGTSAVTDGNWHHIAFVANDNGTPSTQIRIYVDGVRENEIQDPFPIGTWPNPHSIGRRGDGYYFNGTIDELRIYGRALNDTEVNDSYLLQKANATPVANAQSVFTEKNTAKEIPLTGSDFNGIPLTYSVTVLPSHGALGIISASGVVTYTPTADYFGSDSFTFMANNGAQHSAPATVSILVNEVPAAAFTAGTRTGTTPLIVRFTDSSVNYPTSWAWDFGDGSTSTVKNPTHTYLAEGTYTVTLTVTNAVGSDNEIKSGYIRVSEPDPNLPLAEYHFDEAAGTVAYDTSGNGYHGTITGASHSPGLSGNGILFNGISDYIEVPTPYSPENAFTIEAWIKTSSPNVQAIFGGSSTGIDKYHPNLGVGYGISQRAAGCVNYYGAYLSGTSAVTDGNWHHIAFVANDNGTPSTQIRIYVDGVRENEIQDPFPIGTWPNPHSIGRRGDGYYFNGTIDELRIYGRALNDTEVNDSYLLQKANEGLVNHFCIGCSNLYANSGLFPIF